MDRRVFLEWLKEPRAVRKLQNGKKRVIFMDNASGHALTDQVRDALSSINAEIRFLPRNATDLCQPADSFIIQKIKTAWRDKWDTKRLDMTVSEAWTDWKKGSGKLPNPGKKFFLQLAADVIKEVNQQRDKDGILYTRKAMIRCGMACNLNGIWEECQLFPHLQSIISKYRENFEGKSVADSLEIDGAVTETDEDV